MIDTPTAPPAPPPTSRFPTLRDAWPGSEPFRMDGPIERGGFTPLWTALLVFILAWVLFQVIGAIIIGVALAAKMTGGTLDGADPMSFIGQNPRLFLGGNAIGQVFAFGVFALVAARLSTENIAEFLRLKVPDVQGIALAGLGWAALYPVIVWLGDLNAQLPVPQWLETMEQLRTDLLEQVLLGDGASSGFLFLTLAITPALFEEVLFRGYLQRQAERRMSAARAIVIVGVLFGLYHMSLTQAVPLSVLGVYLCFVVWATGSLWAGVFVHLLNNGTAVLIAGAARSNPDFDVESVGELGIPWYLGALIVAAGIAGVTLVVRALHARRQRATGGLPDTAPVSPLSPDSSLL